MKIKKPNRFGRRGATISAAVAVLAVGVVAGLELSGTTHWFGKPASEVVTTVGDKSALEQPQENSSDNEADLPEKTPQPTDRHQIGTGTDTGGEAEAETSQNQWVASESGNVTVKQPAANATISDGAALVGSAEADFVHFRLIGNARGVIARGKLDVVNGEFSAKLNFNAQGTKGRLDVFTQTPGGVEQNQVQIIVKLEQ